MMLQTKTCTVHIYAVYCMGRHDNDGGDDDDKQKEVVTRRPNLRHQRRWKRRGYEFWSRHAVVREFSIRPSLPKVFDINRNHLILVVRNVTVLDVHANPVRTILRGKQQLDSSLTLDLGPPKLRIQLQLSQCMNQVFG